jgi:hypothetical protein
MLIAGLMDLLIASIIIIGLPGSALWAVGLLVGIDLAFGGATLIGMALAAHSGTSAERSIQPSARNEDPGLAGVFVPLES